VRELTTLAAVLCVAMLASWQVAAESAAEVTLVRAARLLDPRTGNALSPAAVLIQEGISRHSIPLSLIPACSRNFSR